MPTYMFSSQGELGTTGYHIAYEQFNDLARDYVTLAGKLYFGAGGGSGYFYGDEGDFNHQSYMHAFNAWAVRSAAAGITVQSMAFEYAMTAPVKNLQTAFDIAVGISQALFEVSTCVADAERKVQGLQHDAPQTSAGGSLPAGMAAGFYAAAAEVEKARQKKEGLDEKYEAWLDKVRDEYPELYAELMASLSRKDREAFEKYLQEYYPEEWERYQTLMQAQQAAAERQKYLEKIKAEDPELYERLAAEDAARAHEAWEKDLQENHPEDWERYQELCKEREGFKTQAEYEAWLEQVRQESPGLYDKIMEREAAKAHAEWEKDLQANHPEEWKLYQEVKAEDERLRKEAEAAAKAAEGLELGGYGSGLGGGDFGSDLGGGDLGGGLGGGGSFGSLDDWSSDLLSDTVDAEELAASGDALADVAGAAAEGAVGSGAGAVGGEGAEAADPGFWGTYGAQLASFAHAYGLQAAALAGGAAALYATREQVTEAVALSAEFVSAKCRPFASDVMDQVRGAAKQTKVRVSDTKSRTTGFAHAEEGGGLLG